MFRWHTLPFVVVLNEHIFARSSITTYVNRILRTTNLTLSLSRLQKLQRQDDEHLLSRIQEQTATLLHISYFVAIDIGATTVVSTDIVNGEHLHTYPELPKLPVPPLDRTLQKYERFLQILLDEKGRERVHNIVKTFGEPGGLGPKLQLYLLDRREKMDNWAYDYWLNDMYLANPLPLPINSNPGMIYPTRKFTTVLDVARFTARLLDGALDHKAKLNRREIPLETAPSREPGQPFCMDQFYEIIGASRLPGKTIDCQYIPKLPEKAAQTAEHVVVICRNHFYCIPLQAPDRGRLTEDEICSQLLHILEEAPNLPKPPPIGIFTAICRPNWFEAREALSCNDQNKQNLELITTSMLVVCLDEPLPASFNLRHPRGAPGHTAGPRDETNICLQMLHGGGSTFNSANRWFDKTIELIISSDGAAGMCYEHSAAEGVAVLKFMEGLLDHTETMPAESKVPAPSCHLSLPQRFEWVLGPDDCKRLEEAASYVDNYIKDLDFIIFRYPNYGKTFMKTCKVSPDVYIQLALQLAYYRLHGKLTATYESASTRRFRRARVDCIRSASVEALEWVTAMSQPKEGDDTCNKKVTFHLVSHEKKMELWHKAVKQQTEEMVDNIMGQGIDIHLLGLREAAKETSPTAAHPLPEIFTDESYKIANTFNLSTSQLITKGNHFMFYGPVTPDGYGAGYIMKNDQVIFILSAFWSSQVACASKFTQAVEESMNSIQALFKSAT